MREEKLQAVRLAGMFSPLGEQKKAWYIKLSFFDEIPGPIQDRLIHNAHWLKLVVVFMCKQKKPLTLINRSD